jgi:hypothetical protein
MHDLSRGFPNVRLGEGTGSATIRPGRRFPMQGPGRTVLAGLGAWQLGGGGCVSSVLIFAALYWVLGYAQC